MNKKISEIFEYGDEMDMSGEIGTEYGRLFDPAEIKEATMKKIHLSQEETARTKKRPRRLLLAAIAAALVLSLTVGAGATGVFDSIFARYTGKTGSQLPPGVNDTVISRAVQVNPEQEQGEPSPLTIHVSEASCDGLSLSVAYTIRCTDEKLNAADTLFEPMPLADEIYTASANGVELGSGFTGWPEFTATGEPGVYAGVISWDFTGHEELQQAETLDVQCALPSLRALSFPKGSLSNGQPRDYGKCEYTEIKTNWSTSFRLTVHPDVQVYEPRAEFGGVVLEKVVLGAGAMQCTFTAPEEMETNAILNPTDDRGETVSVGVRSQGGNWKENGRKNFTIHLAAPERDTDTLTFTVVDWPEEPGDYYADGAVETFPVLGSYTLRLTGQDG